MSSTNSFIHRFNLFLNSLRPASHRFWISQIERCWNNNKDRRIRGIGMGPSRRTIKQRILKKPAVQRRQRPLGGDGEAALEVPVITNPVWVDIWIGIYKDRRLCVDVQSSVLICNLILLASWMAHPTW